MPEPTFTLGRSCITIGNLLYGIGAFIADFNETHVYNPKWPPHARFHNGQTMTLGVLLSSASLYLAYQPALTSAKKTAMSTRESIFWSTVIGSFYCAAGLSAILYPGTDWEDPDTPNAGGGQQFYLFGGVVVAMWVGYGLEVARLGKAKSA